MGAMLCAAPVFGQQVDVASGSVVQAVAQLKPGEFVWAPEVAPRGPMLLIVNIATQRAVLFRNGVPVAATTVSTGRAGHSTPTGVFTILEKKVEHYSSLYDSAPMPYMQRLTWQGVALHAGKLPGFPASHGCIRLPHEFAKLLFNETRVGMTVVVTSLPVMPRVAPTPTITADPNAADTTADGIDWRPALAPTGPVSIIVSSTDKRAVILRNGIVIGSGPVTVEGSSSGTYAYALRDIDQAGQHWMRMSLGQKSASQTEVPKSEWSRFQTSEGFKRAVAGIIEPGTTIVVTTDSLALNARKPTTVLEAAKP